MKTDPELLAKLKAAAAEHRERPANAGEESRVFDATIEVRDGDDNSPTISGYAAVFNSRTEIAGVFREEIAPGAFRQAIEEDDVRALIDHNSTLILGRNTAGTLRLSEDDRGLRYEIDPPNTSYANDLVESMRRGDVSQSSFAFRATSEEWDDEPEDGGLPIRRILRTKLYDVSPVTYPAYPDTEVGVRSLERHRSEVKKTAANPAASKARMRARQRLAETAARDPR